MLRIGDNSILMFAICVSIFGLFIVLGFALKPPVVNENFFWRKPLVGVVFSIICVFGIVAAFLPKQCSESFHFQKAEKNFELPAVSALLKAHHPNCEKFSAHVIYTGNYTFCAACTGLLIGALVALIGTAFYFFGGWSGEKTNFSAILIGVVGVVLGFSQLKFRSFVRLMLNAFFVLGAFLILAGIDGLTQSLYIDLFLMVLIVFWLSTRISLSQWDHWRICSGCKTLCEVRELKKK